MPTVSPPGRLSLSQRGAGSGFSIILGVEVRTISAEARASRQPTKYLSPSNLHSTPQNLLQTIKQPPLIQSGPGACALAKPCCHGIKFKSFSAHQPPPLGGEEGWGEGVWRGVKELTRLKCTLVLVYSSKHLSRDAENQSFPIILRLLVNLFRQHLSGCAFFSLPAEQ